MKGSSEHIFRVVRKPVYLLGIDGIIAYKGMLSQAWLLKLFGMRECTTLGRSVQAATVPYKNLNDKALELRT